MKWVIQISITTALLLGLFMGCTVDRSYQILSTFFDGVPPFHQQAAPGVAVGGGVAKPQVVSLVQHDPYESRDCKECHNPTTKKLTKKVPTLCYTCHGDDFLDDQRKFQEEVVHSPVEDGDCLECHNPHKSNLESLLLKPPGKLCFECHDEEEFQGDVMHTPVTEGRCPKCHNPHQSKQEHLLQVPADRLCFECHKEEEFADELVHSPVEDGECLECHKPHHSDQESLLRKPVGELCFGCHDEENFQGEVVHSPVEDGECMECHNPHHSKGDFLLRKTVVETCFGCHLPDDLNDDEGVHQEKLGALEKLADPVNAGLEDLGICVECHNPHASNHEFLLKEE